MEKMMQHGAAVIGTADRHARKRAELADAEKALAKLQEAKGQVVCVAEATAKTAAERHLNEAARGGELRQKMAEFERLADEYRQMADATAEQVVEQELVVAAAERDANMLAERAKEMAKPFRRQEVPLERKIESLRERLGRAERRGQ